MPLVPPLDSDTGTGPQLPVIHGTSQINGDPHAIPECGFILSDGVAPLICACG